MLFCDYAESSFFDWKETCGVVKRWLLVFYFVFSEGCFFIALFYWNKSLHGAERAKRGVTA